MVHLNEVTVRGFILPHKESASLVGADQSVGENVHRGQRPNANIGGGEMETVGSASGGEKNM